MAALTCPYVKLVARPTSQDEIAEQLRAAAVDISRELKATSSFRT
jgi:hypothetical protein